MNEIGDHCEADKTRRAEALRQFTGEELERLIGLSVWLATDDHLRKAVIDELNELGDYAAYFLRTRLEETRLCRAIYYVLFGQWPKEFKRQHVQATYENMNWLKAVLDEKNTIPGLRQIIQLFNKKIMNSEGLVAKVTYHAWKRFSERANGVCELADDNAKICARMIDSFARALFVDPEERARIQKIYRREINRHPIYRDIKTGIVYVVAEDNGERSIVTVIQRKKPKAKQRRRRKIPKEFLEGRKAER